MNAIISPLVQNGQEVHQIYVTHEDELMCSEKTIYNYIDTCLFDVRNIDLPRKVKFRQRYKKPEFKVDKGCRIGRNYEAFNTFLDKNSDTAVVQMDSVIGTKGGKCLLTIHFVDISLMLAFLRHANTSKSVTDIFEMLYDTLGKDLFMRLFPVILTDNGSEFSNPKAIEYGSETFTGLRTHPPCPCKSEIAAIESAIFSPSFGLEEIKSEILAIESKLFSETFGIAEIKVEVSNIENVVSERRLQIVSPTFGLLEIKSEIKYIESMLIEVLSRLP